MGHMQFQESVLARARMHGVRQEIYSLLRTSFIGGLWGCVAFPVLVVAGLVSYLILYVVVILPSGIEVPAPEDGARGPRWGAMLALPAIFFGIGAICSAFGYLMGRELRLYGERGISIDQGGSKRMYWSPEEIESVEVIDLPENRITFEIHFVDAERNTPFQFITKCPPEKREDLNRGLVALGALRRADSVEEGDAQPTWHTDEADQAAIFMYWIARIAIVGNAMLFCFMMLLSGFLAIVTGERIFLAGTTFFALWLVPLPFMRSFFNSRIRPRYQEVKRRRCAMRE